jgi:hypothetical protein
MEELLCDYLGLEDDPALWEAVVAEVFAGFTLPGGFAFEVGRCSHWLRPHQLRWSAAGGFAVPAGYGSGGGGYSSLGLPQFDWSVILEKTSAGWQIVRRQSRCYPLRLTLPGRSRRHSQAAIHALWRSGKESQRQFFGFRKNPDGWICAAVFPPTIPDRSLLPDVFCPLDSAPSISW